MVTRKRTEYEVQKAAMWLHDEQWNETLTRVNML